MARYLILANQTAASPELSGVVGKLVMDDQQTEFVLLVPATPVCPSVRPGDKPVHLSFGLFLALLFRTVRGHLKEGVDRRTDVSVYDRLIGTQLGFQEKLCAGFEPQTAAAAPQRSTAQSAQLYPTPVMEPDRLSGHHRQEP